MRRDFISVNEPLLDGNEMCYIKEALETGWISSEGPFVRQFEERFSGYVGKKYGIAVANGTAALDIAVAALGIGKGDEVIMPTFTIISCAAAVIRAGARPVLVDSLADTWNMDVGQLEDKITSRTKAIMAVHTYGMPVDMDPLLDIAERYGLAVIEDAAEAIGQVYKSKPCGSFGTISTFSFYPNKHITTGEGGMCLTDDPKLAEKCRLYRNLCFQAGKRFVHEDLGWNYRMTNLQAALGVAQLERLDEFIQRKKFMGARYTQLLEGIEGIQLPLRETNYAENIYWVYGLVLEDSVPFDAKEAMQRLTKAGIGSRPFFWPMHEQPVFLKMGLFAEERYPVSEMLARRGFYIPSGVALTNEQIEKVSQAVREMMA